MKFLKCTLLLLVSFTAFAQNPVPYIAEPLSPTTALPGSQGFTLTVHGDNFGTTSVLEWNGKQRETTVVSSTVLKADIKTSDLTKPGTAQVTVVNLGGSNPTSNVALFTLRKPAPAISLTPDPNFTGNGVFSVVGDINNDGKADVAICKPGTRGTIIDVYLGEGQGKFQPPIKNVLPKSSRVELCAICLAGDFNRRINRLDLLLNSTSRDL